MKELEEVLQSYIKINPTHPSPYIFMYDFLVKRYPDDNSRQISTLKVENDIIALSLALHIYF